LTKMGHTEAIRRTSAGPSGNGNPCVDSRCTVSTDPAEMGHLKGSSTAIISKLTCRESGKVFDRSRGEVLRFLEALSAVADHSSGVVIGWYKGLGNMPQLFTGPQ
jgi:hypothetical protein